jgi:hypothetical protein
MNCEEYINMKIEDAILIADDYRIVKKDGVSFATTCDLRSDRLNFEIKKGIVVKCYLG